MDSLPALVVGACSRAPLQAYRVAPRSGARPQRTLRFLTLPPRQRGWARRPFNSLQSLRHRVSRPRARRHPLAKRRYLRCSPPGTYPGQSSPTAQAKRPRRASKVKRPSSRVFCALSFKSLLIPMAHLRGHCCVRRSPRGVPFSHSPQNVPLRCISRAALPASWGEALRSSADRL